MSYCLQYTRFKTELKRKGKQEFPFLFVVFLRSFSPGVNGTLETALLKCLSSMCCRDVNGRRRRRERGPGASSSPATLTAWSRQTSRRANTCGTTGAAWPTRTRWVHRPPSLRSPPVPMSEHLRYYGCSLADQNQVRTPSRPFSRTV